MTRLIRMLLVIALLLTMPVGAMAHDAYDDSESHPLRIVAYVVHPIGYAVEWLVMRPIHFVVSQPKLERVFGHVPHESPFGEYGAYEPVGEEPDRAGD